MKWMKFELYDAMSDIIGERLLEKLILCQRILFLIRILEFILLVAAISNLLCLSFPSLSRVLNSRVEDQEEQGISRVEAE